MALSGEFFIGDQRIARPETFFGVNPSTGEQLQPAFSSSTTAAVEQAC